MAPDSEVRDLRSADVFLMCCCHAFRDGHLDEAENRLLQSLAKVLNLPSELARRIAARAQQACREGKLEGDSPLDVEELFEEVCRQAAANGRVDDRESRLLIALAQAAQLPAERARAIYAEAVALMGIGPIAGSPAGAAAPESAPESAPEPEVVAETLPATVTEASLEVPGEDLEEDLTGFSAEIPEPSLEERLELFWQAPSFYLKKLVQGSSYERRARQIAKGVRSVLRSTPQGETLGSIQERVDRIVRGVFHVERKYDALVRYLDGRVYPIQGSDLAKGKPVNLSLKPLLEKRHLLWKKLEDTLRSLKEIEDSVALHLLAGDCDRGVTRDLEETLDELGTLLQVAE